VHDIVRADPVGGDDKQEVGMSRESEGIPDFALMYALEAPFGNVWSMMELPC
jgi:hypothetical protein